MRPRRFVRASESIPLIVAALLTISLAAAAEAPAGRLETIAVEGPALAGNALGIATKRRVIVYLPPGYDGSPSRRYPVVYLLHGIGDAPDGWIRPGHGAPAGFDTVQELMDRGIAAGSLVEMIVVMPDARTPFLGCMYTDSPVKGNWERFVAVDLVRAIDARYRTIPRAAGRGLAGHSMGGHGAVKIGMKHPDVFTAVWAMNPALLGWGGDVSAANPAFRRVLDAGSVSGLDLGDPYAVAVVGISQAFSPRPDRPGFFAALPFRRDDDGAIVPDPEPYREWTEQMPLYMLDRHGDGLARLAAFAFDAALDDEFTHIPITTRAFSRELTRRGIRHRFELYNGDHRNRLFGPEGRLATEVLPFMSRHLAPR